MIGRQVRDAPPTSIYDVDAFLIDFLPAARSLRSPSRIVFHRVLANSGFWSGARGFRTASGIR